MNGNGISGRILYTEYLSKCLGKGSWQIHCLIKWNFMLLWPCKLLLIYLPIIHTIPETLNIKDIRYLRKCQFYNLSIIGIFSSE